MARRSVVRHLFVLSAVVIAGCGGPAGPEGEWGAAPSAAQVPSACAGLLPALATTPVDLWFDVGTHTTCWSATTHTSGEVALGFSSPRTYLKLYDASGAPATDPGVHVVDVTQMHQLSYRELDPVFHFSTQGWQGIGYDAFAFQTWSAGGTIVATAPEVYDPVNSAPDGQGGSVFVANGRVSGLGDPRGYLVRVAPGGAIRFEVELEHSPALVLVQWRSDHILVVARDEPPNAQVTRARWFDGSGHPLTPWFSARTSLEKPTALHLLRDGRIALYTGEAWRVAFRDASTIVQKPPVWLARRPGTRLATISGGYAVLTDRREFPLPVVPARIEILTAAGQSCGSYTPPPGPVHGPGVTRTTTSYFVGHDGTLLEASNFYGSAEDLGEDLHCAFRWWPRLLAGP